MSLVRAHAPPVAATYGLERHLMGKGLVVVFAAVLLVASSVFSDCAHTRTRTAQQTSNAR